ncbi:MAG: hypothetical protein WAT71_01350 [Ignavibacteria bacterium]
MIELYGLQHLNSIIKIHSALPGFPLSPAFRFKIYRKLKTAGESGMTCCSFEI